MSPIASQGALFEPPGHKHDLPPTWDGQVVRWKPWQPTEDIQICPPPKPVKCVRCKSTKPPLLAFGLVHPRPGATMTVTETVPSRRQPGASFERSKQVPAWPTLRLSAFRCPDCKLDDVWDRDTDTWWELDDSDYGDEGSHPPS